MHDIISGIVEMVEPTGGNLVAKTSIGWGLIGARGWSDTFIAPAVNKARGARLCGVLSSKRESAAKFCERHGVANGYTNIDEFLEDPSIDAVWVVSPNYLHKDHVMAALRAGKHVLCEKPLAMSAAECRAMIRAANKADRLLGVGYNTRFHPRLRAFQADWAAGRYGDPVHVHCQFHFRYAHLPPDWWRLDDKRSGVWVLGDLGTHLIDLLRWHLGEAKTVHGHLSNKYFGHRSADFAFLTIGFKNGAVGTLAASTGNATGARLEFLGTNGSCQIDGGVLGFEGSMTTARGKAKPRTVALPAVDTYRAEAESFTRAVAHGDAFAVNAADGLANVRIIEQARGW